jgi:histidinol-phosphatase
VTQPALALERAFAHELADLADAITLPAAGLHGRDVAATKSDGSWVTAIDHEVERAIRAAIAARFPEHAVLGEEDGLTGDPSAPTWVIDPIDGTAGFVRGTNVWATLIGLRVAGDDRLGVVSAPALGHRWDGVVGHGATMDGAAIYVSTVPDLQHAEVAFGDLDCWRAEDRWDAVARLIEATRRVRSYGDFWSHCLVASGAVELAAEASLSVWDLVAVRAIVLAAGGRCTTLDGSETSDGGHALSTNGLLHDAVLALVAS